MQLPGKVTVVTGAGRGIGAALACRFAQEGARAVFVVDRDEEQARKLLPNVVESLSWWMSLVNQKSKR